jgi:hypothetical protein
MSDKIQYKPPIQSEEAEKALDLVAAWQRFVIIDVAQRIGFVARMHVSNPAEWGTYREAIKAGIEAAIVDEAGRLAVTATINEFPTIRYALAETYHLAREGVNFND